MTLQHRGILRLGYVRLALADPRLRQSRAWYTETLGMQVTHVSPGRLGLRCWHEPWYYSLFLEEATEAGLVELGFEVRDEQDLRDLGARLEQLGLQVSRADAGAELPGIGASITFSIPGGQQLRLFAGMQQPGYLTGYESPDWNVPRELRTTPAPWFMNHVGITSPDPGATVEFLREQLGFIVSEKLLSDEGDRLLSALLVRTNDGFGQDLAVFPGPAGRLHHIAFVAEDESDLLHSAMLLRESGVRIDRFGPMRHSYGRTFSVYFYDPQGVRLELCTGGRFADCHPEYEPVVWRESQWQKALSFFDTVDNPEFLAPSV